MLRHATHYDATYNHGTKNKESKSDKWYDNRMEAVLEWYRYVDGFPLRQYRIEIIVFQVSDLKCKFVLRFCEENIDCFSLSSAHRNTLGRINKIRCMIRVIAI